MHASPRDRTWLYHIMCGYTYIYTLKATLALHHMWHRVRVIGGSCTNCGVIRESGGLCARCLDLPYCKKCKRHLSHSSFNEEQHHIFQVPLHVAIACIIHLCIPVPRLYKSHYHLTSRYHIVTRSLVCVCLQNCEKRRTIRRTTLNNFISETTLPVTEYDTSFETLINTRRHAIDDIVRDALRQHGY